MFPFASDEPIRIEMFEEEVESLRTVRSRGAAIRLQTHERIEVCLASDGSGGLEDGEGVSVIDLVDPSALCVRVEPLRIDERSKGLAEGSVCPHERALMILTADPLGAAGAGDSEPARATTCPSTPVRSRD